MPLSEKKRISNDKYIKSQDNITTRYRSGSRTRIQAAADQSGISMNQFIVNTVMERVQAIENKPTK